MRIVIDLRMYGPRATGIGRYNQQLLANLVKQDSTNEYILLFSSRPSDVDLPSNFQIRIVRTKWYSLAEQLFLPSQIRKLNPDLVHFTHFNVPIFYRKKFIVTIHDLIMNEFGKRNTSNLKWPIFFFKRIAYKAVIRNAIKKSTRIITVSKYVKADILRQYPKVDENKIKVIYEGLTKISHDSKEKLDEKYFLYVGSAYPHKNLATLIKAFASFCMERNDHKLYLVGANTPFYEKTKQWLNNNYKQIYDNVVFTGFLNDEELAKYYNGATAFIFPSLYEGFGLPPLEAMQHNVPVISSSASCLPEILGDAAMYFNANDSDELKRSMIEIVSNSQLRNDLIIKSKKLLGKYNWQNTAKETIKLYSSV